MTDTVTVIWNFFSTNKLIDWLIDWLSAVLILNIHKHSIKQIDVAEYGLNYWPILRE